MSMAKMPFFPTQNVYQEYKEPSFCKVDSSKSTKELLFYCFSFSSSPGLFHVQQYIRHLQQLFGEKGHFGPELVLSHQGP